MSCGHGRLVHDLTARELLDAGLVVTGPSEPRPFPWPASEAGCDDYQRWFADSPTMLTAHRA